MEIRKVNMDSGRVTIGSSFGVEFPLDVAILSWEKGKVRVAPYRKGDDLDSRAIFKRFMSKGQLDIPRRLLQKAGIGAHAMVTVEDGDVVFYSMRALLEEEEKAKSADENE